MSTQQPPNIVFVLTDDQGCGDLGCLGNPIVQTPNLDSFHDESIRLRNHHVGPTCAPTRSGLITGHYANSTGVWHTVGGRSLLRGNETTLADIFKKHGYRTGLFGKWHLGDNYPYRPQDRGFDECIVHGGGAISNQPDYWQNDYFDDTYLVNGEPRKFEGYCTDVWFREGMAFMERNRDNPFVCFITPNAPHSPWNVEKEYSDPYKDKAGTPNRERFYGMITNIDENFGKMLSHLDDLSLSDNTIVVFMTDNGTSCGVTLDEDEFVTEGYNLGMRGKKGSAYDGGHRVPFFIRYPQGNFKGPRDIEELTSFVDFLPTLMDLSGIDLSSYEELSFHGKSLAPLLRDDSAVWEDRMVTTDSQRLVFPVKWRQSSVMSQRWRLINGEELYDMNSDPGQTRDVSSEFPEVVAQHRDAYEDWWDLVSVQFEEAIPISIGTDHEKETRLNSHDWRDLSDPRHTDPKVNEDHSFLVFCQSQVRKGAGENGYLEVMVEKIGRYHFELRRWPKEEDRAITDGIEPSGEGWRSDLEIPAYVFSGGEAMPFTRASLKVGDQFQEKEIEEGAKGVSFEFDLSTGVTRLVSSFEGAGGLKRGAYYVYASRLED